MERCTFWIACQMLKELLQHGQILTRQECLKQGFSRLPVQVDSAFGYSGLSGYIINGGLVISPALYQCRGGIQDTLSALLPPGTIL